MKIATSFLAALLLVGSLGASGTSAIADEAFPKGESVPGSNVGADGILLKEQLAPGSNYGHLRFPAIREETLGWERPVLKDATTGDIIDFYGPLDHDPLGKDEIASQKRQAASDND